MKHSAIRDNIIQTASRLFYQNGYNLTGINEIIREAGIAKATLYSHFSSKTAICVAYLEHKDEQLMRDLTEFVNKYAVGKERVLSLFDFLQSFYHSDGFNGCWCINTVSELPYNEELIRKVIKKQKKGLMQFIQHLIVENLTQKTSEENEVLSRQVYLLYEGAITESHLHQDVWPVLSARSLCDKLIS